MPLVVICGFRRAFFLAALVTVGVLLHGERDAVAFEINIEHSHVDHVAGLDHGARIADEFVGEFGDVHQAVLVHADVDEGAERSDVSHDPFEQHSLFQVLEFFDAFFKRGGGELRARVAARFVEFGDDVAHGRFAELFIGEIFRFEFFEEGAVADQCTHIAACRFRDALHDRISFGMHGRSVERVVAVHDAQKARRLFEGFGSQARHLQQGLAVFEDTVLVAVLDNILRQRGIQPGDVGQQRGGGGIDINPDGVDAILDHGFQRFTQPVLVNIMLVLADADRLGFDLHQLGERILQTARNRNRAADGNVKLGKLARRKFRGRVHRGTRFADHDFGQTQFGMAFDEFGGELVGFARSGAVADADKIDVVLLAQLAQHVQRLVPLILGLVRINSGVIDQLASIVNHRRLDARAQARVQTQRGARPRRGGQQQIF